MVAVYLARELTGESYPALGRQFGGRDHSTMMGACERAEALLALEPDLRARVNKIRGELTREVGAA